MGMHGRDGTAGGGLRRRVVRRRAVRGRVVRRCVVRGRVVRGRAVRGRVARGRVARGRVARGRVDSPGEGQSSADRSDRYASEGSARYDIGLPDAGHDHAGHDPAGHDHVGLRPVRHDPAGLERTGHDDARLDHAGLDHAGLRPVLAREAAPWSATMLDAGIAQVQGVDPDELGVPALERALEDVTGVIRRLQATQTLFVGSLHRRRVLDAPAGEGPDRAERQTARFLADKLHVPPSEAKRTSRTARHLEQAPLVKDRFEAGELSPQHVGAITDALPDIPEELRSSVEADLVALSRTATPGQVAQEGRRRITLADQETAGRRERSRRTRRRAMWRTVEDGGLRVDATLYGLDAETVRVALDAATAPPGNHELRSHDQRRADGLVNLCKVSLGAGELPAQHGVRPHVNVTVSLADLRAWTGVATLGGGETVTMEELGGLLQDCTVSRTILGLRDAPIAGSVGSRTVPAALWRALVDRDRGCTWDNCDAPAAWCQVAHGEVPFAADGRLSPDNAALLCGHHHRRFDRGGWEIRIDGSQVSYHHDPDRPSVRELAQRAELASRAHPSMPNQPAHSTRAAPSGRSGPSGWSAPSGPSTRSDQSADRSARSGSASTAQRAEPAQHGPRAPRRVLEPPDDQARSRDPVPLPIPEPPGDQGRVRAAVGSRAAEPPGDRARPRGTAALGIAEPSDDRARPREPVNLRAGQSRDGRSGPREPGAPQPIAVQPRLEPD